MMKRQGSVFVREPNPKKLLAEMEKLAAKKPSHFLASTMVGLKKKIAAAEARAAKPAVQPVRQAKPVPPVTRPHLPALPAPRIAPILPTLKPESTKVPPP